MGTPYCCIGCQMIFWWTKNPLIVSMCSLSQWVDDPTYRYVIWATIAHGSSKILEGVCSQAQVNLFSAYCLTSHVTVCPWSKGSCRDNKFLMICPAQVFFFNLGAAIITFTKLYFRYWYFKCFLQVLHYTNYMGAGTNTVNFSGICNTITASHVQIHIVYLT